MKRDKKDKLHLNIMDPNRIRQYGYTLIIVFAVIAIIFWKNDKVDSFRIEEFLQLFNVFWGVSITALIFIIEISSDYKYGISLKRLINRMLGTPLIILLGIYFVLLCPMAHLASAMGYADALFVLCIEILVLFLLAIGYISAMSIGSNIEKVIVYESKKNINEYCNQNSPIQKSKIKRATYFIDQLLLSEMIEHVDVHNIFEVEIMVRAVCDIINEVQLKKYEEHMTMEYTLLMAIVRKIVTRFNILKKLDREYTCNILIEIWKKLMKDPDKNVENYQRETSITLQLVLPLIECNNSEATDCFINVWNKIHGTEKTLIYILLYMEYQHLQENQYKYLEKWTKNVLLCEQLKNCLEGKFAYDNNFAYHHWIDWNEFYVVDEQLNLLKIHDFFEDVMILHGESENSNGCIKSAIFWEVRECLNVKD